MDFDATTEQLKQAALTENPTLFESTWNSVVADHESIPALESPIENLEKAVFAKDLPLVRSILEEEKDNIVIQKMGLQFSIPLKHANVFDINGSGTDKKNDSPL